MTQNFTVVVFQDIVVDIHDFAERHPGTAARLRALLGREISQWIYGSFEKLSGKRKHSSHALGLIRKYQVGTIQDSYPTRLHRGLEAEKKISDYVFRMSEQEGVTDLHISINLSNKDIRIPILNDVRDFGKYYAITSEIKKMTRNYYCIFTANEDIAKEHALLVKALAHNKIFTSSYKSIEAAELASIPIVINQKGEFSGWLMDEAREGCTFRVAGPFGPGLELDPNENGTIAIIAGGVSIFFYFDLCMYLLRMNAAKKGKEFEVFPGENFTQLSSPGFKLILFSSFKSEAVPFLMLFKGLENMKANNFEYHLRIGSVNPKYWDASEFKEKIPASTKRIYVSGGLNFTENILKELSIAGVPTSKLAFL